MQQAQSWQPGTVTLLPEKGHLSSKFVGRQRLSVGGGLSKDFLVLVLFCLGNLRWVEVNW